MKKRLDNAGYITSSLEEYQEAAKNAGKGKPYSTTAKEYRKQEGISPAIAAEILGMEEGEYVAFEEGRKELPESSLYTFLTTFRVIRKL